MALTLYGIKNCDTMKRARTWLKDNNIDYVFHNYKKDGADKAVIQQAIDAHGWEAVMNTRGTTWRQIPDKIKKNIDAQTALTLAMENPSVIKRPLMVYDNSIYLGFSFETYADIFKK